jgi:ELWxxDGT repeat protein
MKKQSIPTSLAPITFSALLCLPTARADNPVYAAQRIGSITNISGVLANCGGDLYLSGYDTIVGYELRKLNATDSDLDLVQDLSAGTATTVIDRITKVGTKVFFRATVSGSGLGSELYVSDGSSASLVRDIRSGSISTTPDNFAALGNTLFFTANDGINGNELWSSDGTSAGTTLFKDFRPSVSDSSNSCSQFTPLTIGGVDYLYFSANTTASGPELWRTDGTLGGTTQVADIYPGASSGSNLGEITSNGTGFYFKATDGSYGLFSSNGSSVTKIKVINDATSSGAPSDLAWIGSRLFFTAYQTGNGQEPWISDGTLAGTKMIKDLGNEFNGNSNPSEYTQAVNGIVFQAGTSATGHELYVTDGTSSGTNLLKDINTGANTGISNAAVFTKVGDYVFFAANDGINGTELWVTDGTAAGTYMALDMNPGSGTGIATGTTMVNLNGTLYFRAFDGTSTNLYKLVTGSSAMSCAMTTGERGHMSMRSASGLGSDASLRFAAATTVYTCSLTYRERSSSELSHLLSDVLDVSGSGSNQFLLQLSYSPAVLAALGTSKPMLGWYSSGAWVNAILGNAGMASLSTAAVDALFVNGPYTEGLPTGSWGHDAANHLVWAVLDHNSEFAATPVTRTAAYATWIDGYYPASTDSTVIASSADPDGDGLANSIEYVLGTSPASSTQSSLPTLEKTATTVTFRFTRSKAAGAAGFASSVQYSTNLSADSWTTATAAMTTVTDSSGNEIVTVSLPATGSTLFARLVVSSL